MGIYDIYAKTKRKAQSVAEFTSEVKEKGIGGVAKDIASNTKESINESIEIKKENAELARQKREDFKEKQAAYKSIFRSTQKMGDIEIDEVNKLLKINNASSNIKKNGKIKILSKSVLAMYTLGASLAIEMALKPGDVIFSYDEIQDYDLLENNISVESGGLGMAVVGGVVAGSTGGIIGGLTAKRKTSKSIDMLALQITTTNFCFPSIIISYIKSETKSKSSRYTKALSHARNTIACLNLIFAQCENSGLQSENQTEDISDPYEELKKAKELYDLGIITQDEFEEKKKQLLGLQ